MENISPASTSVRFPDRDEEEAQYSCHRQRSPAVLSPDRRGWALTSAIAHLNLRQRKLRGLVTLRSLPRHRCAGSARNPPLARMPAKWIAPKPGRRLGAAAALGRLDGGFDSRRGLADRSSLHRLVISSFSSGPEVHPTRREPVAQEPTRHQSQTAPSGRGSLNVGQTQAAMARLTAFDSSALSRP